MIQVPIVKNSKGEEIKLNPVELANAQMWQGEIERRFKGMILNPTGNMELHNAMQAGEFKNALGFDISITALTTIVKQVSEQKFYKIPFAQYLPVRVGQGAWSLQLTTFLSYQFGDDFEKGNIGTGHGGARLDGVDAGVSAINVPVINWCKGNGYNVFELNFAMRAGNWDIVSSKEQARKENWDLGLQKIAFLGSSSNANVMGLLNQSDVAYNQTLITQALSAITPEDYSVFCAGLLDAYRTNCNRTAWPDIFVMPESDYLGMAAPINVNFGAGKSRLQLLKDILNTMIYGDEKANKFEIKSLAYADQANSGYGYQQYALYNRDEKSLRMDIPVDYTSTLMNTINGFQFENAAYGQYTGVKAYRPLEMLYFKY